MASATTSKLPRRTNVKGRAQRPAFSFQAMAASGALYQLGLGVRYAATDKIGLDLGYRYRVQPDAEVTGGGFVLDPEDSITGSATNHIVTAGVTVGF